MQHPGIYNIHLLMVGGISHMLDKKSYVVPDMYVVCTRKFKLS